uniref:Uncharacterized protein n=1 Tax=Rhizophora mucronata TaxID=61149 RepID=A0A2P2KK96_RHIMU
MATKLSGNFSFFFRFRNLAVVKDFCLQIQKSFKISGFDL